MEVAADQERRFKALLATSQIVSLFGWLTAGGGAVVCLIALTAVAGSRRGSLLGALVAASPGFLGVVAGILVVAAGQLISCILAIEENTRAIFSAQNRFLDLTGNKMPALTSESRREPAAAVGAPAPKPVGNPVPQTTKPVTCPHCEETEHVQRLYDVGQYRKFEAVDKSRFGFQSLSLTCRRCGQEFRI